jgi:hypothetical protein
MMLSAIGACNPNTSRQQLLKAVKDADKAPSDMHVECCVCKVWGDSSGAAPVMNP